MNLQAVSEAISAGYEPGVGHPSRIAEAAVLQLFFAELESGLQLEAAAALAGLASRTVYNWLKRGEDGEEPYAAFMRTTKRARAVAEQRITKNMVKASDDPRFWAAGATLLERSYPDRWGRRSEGGNTPQVVVQVGVAGHDVQVMIGASAPVADVLDTTDGQVTISPIIRHEEAT